MADVRKALNYAKVWAWVMQSLVASDNPWFYRAVDWLNLKPISFLDEQAKQVMERGGVGAGCDST